MTVGVCFSAIYHIWQLMDIKYVSFAFKTWNKSKRKPFLINYKNAISSWIYLDLIEDGYHTFFAYSFRLA